MVGSERRRSLKRRLSRAVETRLVNRVVRTLLARGRLGGTYAVLETVGRRSGRARRTPVANGLQGDTFWLLCAHGDGAHYARNIAANPHVRIGVVEGHSLRWRTGVAVPLPADDARARQRELGRGRLGYRLDAVLLRALATDLMTIRVDLQS
ncbi:MAG: nitroreductase family deazaflavin-dependent oxidoreductase [Actinobacteria bacterium]|nr:MAG: nitroreductase family deazaflavin-dependent oxidoreductase [Actinomycetota bacterium]